MSEEEGVIGFYFPDRWEPVDTLCRYPELANFWLAPMKIGCPAEPDQVEFRNAEAAFQALKFWGKASLFSSLSGTEAFKLKKQLGDRNADRSYGGYGSNWNAMLAVVRAKFTQNPVMRAKLLATNGTFLLEHNSVCGRDMIWSNNSDGEGTNWLGAALMQVYDEIAGTDLWTSFIARNTRTANSGPTGPEWQNKVRQATQQIATQLMAPSVSYGAICVRPGCGSPSWNGQQNEFCTNSCKNRYPPFASSIPHASATRRTSSAAGVALCIRPNCGSPSWNGQQNEFCSMSCKNGIQPPPAAIPFQRQSFASSIQQPSATRRSSSSSATRRSSSATRRSSLAAGVALCIRPNCGMRSWNGQQGEYCSMSCKNGIQPPPAAIPFQLQSFASSSQQAPAARQSSNMCVVCKRQPSYKGMPGKACSQTCRRIGCLP